MPFVSKKQQAFAFATKQPWAKEFAKATKNFSRLPKYSRTRAAKRKRSQRKRGR